MKDKKHIVVTEETKRRFEEVKERQGMTQDGLIRFWLDKDQERKAAGVA